MIWIIRIPHYQDVFICNSMKINVSIPVCQ